MSFKSTSSSDDLRRELEGILRLRLEAALERYRAAAAKYQECLHEGPCGRPPGELQRIIKAEADALQEHSRMLAIFTDLVMEGKAPEADEAIGVAGTTSAIRICVVDDDESIRDSAKMLLRSAGYQVATFDSSQAFLDSPELALTDCLVLDIRMPGMDGLELQRHLNSTQAGVPIVFLTARDDAVIRRSAIGEGASDFLRKPFEADSLVLAIRTALTRNRMAQAERARKNGGGQSPHDDLQGKDMSHGE
jgi:CheY-like chemotaxis protein